MTTSAKNLHIVAAQNGDLILVRDAGATWRTLQESQPDYMTSLGPMDRDGALELFGFEWPDVLTAHGDTIRGFLDASNDSGASEVRLVMPTTASKKLS